MTDSIVSHVKEVLLPVSPVAVLRIGQHFPSSDLSRSAIEVLSKDKDGNVSELMSNIAETDLGLQKTFLEHVGRYQELLEVNPANLE